MLCLTFPENSFHFVAQKLKKKTWKMAFSKVQNIPFWPQGSFKTIEFKKFWLFAPLSPLASLGCWNICKNVKNAILKCSGEWVASKVSF